MNYLIKKDFTIIFRPHPMSLIRTKRKLRNCLKFEWYEKFKLNTDSDNNNVFESKKY